MIADDMMSFIKSDILVFELSFLLYNHGNLQNLKWVITLIRFTTSVIIMIGLLGLIG